MSTVLTPDVLAVIRESVAAAPPLGPRQREWIRSVWAPAVRNEFARRSAAPAGAVTTHDPSEGK